MPELRISTHLDKKGHPMMVDVSGKAPTWREAVAEGFVSLTDAIVLMIENNDTEKGDVLKIAEVAGIMAAKRTTELIPLCHPIRLDSVRVECTLGVENKKIEIRAYAGAGEVTGVEMEALTAVSVAALTIYDMCKGIDKGMSIDGIRLLRKSGGKSGDYRSASMGLEKTPFLPKLEETHVIRAAVLTVSDKGSRGERRDTSGPALCELLEAYGAEVAERAIVPDERNALLDRLGEWATNDIQLILTTGGTGLSPRDITPEVLTELADRVVPGIGELMRAESQKHTPNAALSRGIAVSYGRCLIVALPGSERGASQCFEVIRPALRHAVEVLNGWTNEGDVPASAH